MSRFHSPAFPRAALAMALCALFATAVTAQDVPAPASSTSTTEMSAMPGMDMGSTPAPAATRDAPPAPASVVAPASGGRSEPMPGMDHDAMPGMDHGSMQGMDHGSVQGTGNAPAAIDHGPPQRADHGAMKGMDHGSQPTGAGSMQGMGPMQGGDPPADARSPDYSAGVGYGLHPGMDMAMDDNVRIGMLLIDQLEAFHGKQGHGQQWDIEGRYGNDYDKLWLRTEGERSGGKLVDGDLEAFWNHTVATFWSTQLGVRADAGEGPNRQWAAFGLQGLAPYWFELEATGYLGAAGRTAVRLRAEYELLFTQRLILQPEFEANAYGKADPARRLGRGVSDAAVGLRLRYAWHRQFAPYVGVVWTRRFGGTADFARKDGQRLLDRQWVAGVRLWF